MSGNIPSQITHMLSFLELSLVFILDLHVYIDDIYTYRTNTHITYCRYILSINSLIWTKYIYMLIVFIFIYIYIHTRMSLRTCVSCARHVHAPCIMHYASCKEYMYIQHVHTHSLHVL